MGTDITAQGTIASQRLATAKALHEKTPLAVFLVGNESDQFCVLFFLQFPDSVY